MNLQGGGRIHFDRHGASHMLVAPSKWNSLTGFRPEVFQARKRCLSRARDTICPHIEGLLADRVVNVAVGGTTKERVGTGADWGAGSVLRKCLGERAGPT